MGNSPWTFLFWWEEINTFGGMFTGYGLPFLLQNGGDRGPGFQLSAVLLSVECFCPQNFQYAFLGFVVPKSSCDISSF